MRLGIVTTCFGHAQYLDEMLASIISQTREPRAHVVVSDGDDKAAQVFERYTSHLRIYERIHIRRRLPGGPAVAWNEAVAAMPSDVDWVIKIDADDVASPKLVESIARAGRRLIDVVVPALWHFGIPTGKSHIWRFERWKLDRHLQYCCAPAQSAVRRALWDLVGGVDETMPSAEDWDFFYRLGLAKPGLIVETLGDALWGYRNHDTSYRASGPFHEHLGAYQDYAKHHTRESVLARSRNWSSYCAELTHGGAPWLKPLEISIEHSPTIYMRAESAP